MIKKWRVFFFYTNEEKWLNDMSVKGFHLVKYRFLRYHFEQGQPGKYEYRLELLSESPSTTSSQDYLEFMEETGIECVDTFGNWVYFRKEATSEPFEIYTDAASKIKHVNRIMLALAIAFAVNLIVGVTNVVNGLHISRYISILNLLIVIILFPILLKYVKMKQDIKRNT